MKVYIVTAGCYSDYGIDAVFESKEKAEIYCAVHPREDQEIEEWETEDHSIITDKPVYRKWVGKINENEKIMVYNEGYTFENIFKVKYVPSAYFSKSYIKIEMATNKDKTEEQAKKIMLDKFAAWKYEKEMGLNSKTRRNVCR